MAHGCSVQWNSVVAIAVCTASGLPASPVPGGGVARWATGSATPKNIRPIPMPAENIIAIHDTVRNSGSSSSRPSGMLPYLLAASQMTKTTKPEATSANNQPVLCTTQDSPELEAEASVSVL